MDSKASAQWTGNLKEGNGEVSVASGALSAAGYRYPARFEGAKGLTPEELIGAAHAACFSMAVSAELGRVGITPKSVRTNATVTLEKGSDGFNVTKSQLDVMVIAPGADLQKVTTATVTAKNGCPISKLLRAEVTLNAQYEV